MSELQNIDKLLKESFSDFAPDAPDVWQGVQQGVQAAQAGHAAGTAGAVKGGIGLVTKIIGVVAVSASLVTGVILLNGKKEEAPVQTAAQQLPAPTEPQAVVPVEPQPEAPIVAETGSGKATAPEHHSAETHKGGRHHADNGGSAPDKPAGTVSDRVNTTDATTTPAVAKTTAANDAVSGKTTAATSTTVYENTSAGTKPQNYTSEQVIKKEEVRERKADPPFNPNAEDGEVYEKPTIPGSFSPDGNGLNDHYKIVIENEVLYSLMILDKTGRVVFESDNQNNTWDGRDMRTGMMCEQGFYTFSFRYQFQGSQKQHQKTGIIALIK